MKWTADKLCAYAAKNKVPLEINMLGMREHRHYLILNFLRLQPDITAILF